MRKIQTLTLLLMAALVLAVATPALAEEGKTALETFLTSEAFANIVIGAIALGLAALRLRANDEQRKIIDMAVGIANAVEKGIPDSADGNGTLGKMDRALRRFRRDWEKVKGQAPKDAIMAAARGAIERWVADRNAGRHL